MQKEARSTEERAFLLSMSGVGQRKERKEGQLSSLSSAHGAVEGLFWRRMGGRCGRAMPWPCRMPTRRRRSESKHRRRRFPPSPSSDRQTPRARVTQNQSQVCRGHVQLFTSSTATGQSNSKANGKARQAELMLRAEARTAVPSAERFSDGIGIWIEGKATKTKTIFILDIFLFVLHPAAAWC